jgi:hypothetical protein
MAVVAEAQQITRSEFGVGVYEQANATYNGVDHGPTQMLLGPFARYTYNLNRSLALETSISDSVNMAPSSMKMGGHQLLMLAGIKAGVRRKNFGLFGRLDAGANSFSRGDEVFYTSTPTFYRETHFALQPGLSLEGYVGRRTILRLDADEDLNAIFRTQKVLSPSSTEFWSGAVPNHLGLGLSLEHRFGRLEDAPDFTSRSEPFSVGAYFPLQIRQHQESFDAPALGGGGAWIGVPVSRFFSFDVAAFDIPHDDRTAGPQEGGTSFEAHVGPKVGIHFGRLGLFAKARPGITRFSRTASSLTELAGGGGISVFHPQVDFSLDTGGVMEYVISRHLLLRFEAGNDLTFLREHAETFQTPFVTTIAHAPAEVNNSILFLGGLGWRF